MFKKTKYNSKKIVRFRNGLAKKIEYEALKSLALYSDMDKKKQKKWREELKKHADVFDSKKELEFYEDLLRMEKNGHIKNIVLQPVVVLQERNKKHKLAAITYKLDFSYTICDTNESILVDIKGMATEVAKLKRKLLLDKIDREDTEEIVKWLVYYNGQWVDYFENEARKRKNRKDKKNK